MTLLALLSQSSLLLDVTVPTPPCGKSGYSGNPLGMKASDYFWSEEGGKDKGGGGDWESWGSVLCGP